MTFLTGIDPGASGALVTLDADTGELVDHYLIRTIGAGSRKRVDGRDVADYLRPYVAGLVVIEQVHSMPSDGVKSAFSFGRNLGSVMGIVEALDMPLTEVAPTTWMPVMLRGHARSSLAIRKANLTKVAVDTFPRLRGPLKLKKNQGLADAALIAQYQFLQTRRRPA